MIVVYPMLTSPSVSPNVLPGIVKAVEKYILVYRTDEVLRYASATSAGSILSTGVKITATAAATAAATALAAYGVKQAGEWWKNEGEGQNNFEKDMINEIKKLLSEKEKGASGTEIKMSMPKITPVGGGSGAKPQLQFPSGDAVSLEPTWLNVTTERSGMQILGVKVVPFRIKYPDSIVSLLMQDKSLKDLNFLTSKYMRGMSRVLGRVLSKVPMRGGSALTGSFKKDVLEAQTTYGKNIFICLSQLDLDADEALSTPAGVRRLHQLGWSSLIIANDVNRTGTFCMKEFSGICSVVPYSYMFASLGREQSKAYEDLEDLKKKSGPFFKMSTNRKRVFSSESMRKTTIVDKYLELLEKENE
jgi:hypothetical protein